MSNTFRSLKGKHFAFFGGTAGIGLAAAKALAEEGACIAVVGRSAKPGQEAVATLLSCGAQEAIFIAGDLSTHAGARAVATRIQQWSPSLDGITHSALTAFNEKTLTADGLEFAYAMQYQIRVVLDNLLLDNLAASGDGRIVHLAGAAPAFMTPDLDDLQCERRKWNYWTAMIGSHNLTFMFIQEAQKRWKAKPVSIAAICVGSTKTKLMSDSTTPFLMRLLGYFGTTPEASGQNIVTYMRLKELEQSQRYGVYWNSSKPVISQSNLAIEKAEKLWLYTKKVAQECDTTLEHM